MALRVDNPTLLQSVLAVARLDDVEETVSFAVFAKVVDARDALRLEDAVCTEVVRGEITGPQTFLRVAGHVSAVATSAGHKLDPGYVRAGELWKAFQQTQKTPVSKAEAVNPALDATLRAGFDDAACWAVYADWWLERGDARGELVRHADEKGRLPGAGVAALDAHWPSWYGALTPDNVPALAYGFARALVLPRFAFVKVLARRPSLRFVRHVTVSDGFRGRLAGLEEFPALEHVSARLADETLATLLAGPLVERLTQLDLYEASVADVDLLRAQQPRLAHLTLSLSAGEPTLAARRAEFRAAFPRARLTPTVPGDTYSLTFSPGPSLSDVPTRAPKNFLQLEPYVQTASSYGEFQDHTTWQGSGTPCEDYEDVRRCFGCASDQVLCIWGDRSRLEITSESETQTINERELVCSECGRFTRYRTIATH